MCTMVILRGGKPLLISSDSRDVRFSAKVCGQLHEKLFPTNSIDTTTLCLHPVQKQPCANVISSLLITKQQLTNETVNINIYR